MLYRVPVDKTGNNVYPCAYKSPTLPSSTCPTPGIYIELLLYLLEFYDPQPTLKLQPATAWSMRFGVADFESELLSIRNFSLSNFSVSEQIYFGHADITLPYFMLNSWRIERFAFLPLVAKRFDFVFLFRKRTFAPQLNFVQFLGKDLLLSIVFALLFMFFGRNCLKVRKALLAKFQI